MARIARAALAGLTLALLVAGGCLAFIALRTKPDCTQMSQQECALETSVVAARKRMQALGAVGCSTLAAGGALWLRASQGEKR